MKNKYILIRHGETKYQATNSRMLYSSKEQFSLPITKEAEEIIKKQAQKLKKVDLIYSSDYYRTKQTSNILAKELNLKIKLDKRLRDINFGIFTGKSAVGYKAIFSSRMQRFSKRPPKGESWRDVKKRVVSFLKEIDKEHLNKTILIVSHADPIWLLAGFLRNYNEKETLEKKTYEEIYPDVGQIIEL